MRDFNITIENQSPQTIAADAGFVEEIGATRLVISLGGEMAKNDIDYYVIDFELSSPLRRVKSCRIYPSSGDNSEAYIDNGIIYCTLWQELTMAPRLRFQLEAYRLDDNNEVKSVTRSGVVTLNLLQGVAGEEGTADTGVHGLLAEMQHMESSLSSLSETATTLYNQATEMFEDIVNEVGDNIEIYIGDNGNWFYKDRDLGIKAQGEKGDTGAPGPSGENAHVHIRYATSATPSSLLTEPNEYMGIYSGVLQNAPTNYSEYKWYKIKGEQGLPGNDGQNGKGLEYNWSGTSLGIKIEGDSGDYTYVNLKGDVGPSGNNGQDGSDGVSPIISVNTNTGTEYTLNITDKNGTITTPNLKGADGTGAGNSRYLSSAELDGNNLVLTMSDDTTVQTDISGVVDGYVNETRKIAGLDLQDDIMADELEKSMSMSTCTEGVQFEYKTDHYRVKQGEYESLVYVGNYIGTDTDIVIPKWYNDGTHGWALVTEIGTGAFAEENITSVKIPDSVTSIKNQAFRKCTKLTTVYLTRNTTQIASMAFTLDSSLTTVYFDGTAEDKKLITISSNNAPLEDAEWKYNYAVPTKTSDLTNDSNFVVDASYVHTDYNYSSTDRSKLLGIAKGAEVNVQSDWNEEDSTKDSYILNKPTIPSEYSLPTASTSVLGGVMTDGNTIKNSGGVISVNDSVIARKSYVDDLVGDVETLLQSLR